MTPAVLTADQAAELIGCTAAELAELAAAGAVPAVTIGATTIYPARALDDWLNEQALVLWRIHAELAAAGVHLR